MERDVVVAHGITQFLKETTMERSDKYCCYVSDHTGEIAAVNPNAGDPVTADPIIKNAPS